MTAPGPLPDVAVVGAGIVGCAAAAFLAEAGASVRLYDREAIAAGASGRNSGVLQHPLDEALTGLYEESLRHYAQLEHGFAFPPQPAGVLVVSERPEPLAADREALAARFPDLAPEWLEGEALAAAEPALGPGLSAYRLSTGRPVPPAAAAHAFARRAAAAGAQLVIGAAVTGVAQAGGRATGVVVGGVPAPAGAIVIAAGPWTPEILAPGAGWRPIGALWGVVAEVRLAAPPRHVLEQAGVEALTEPGGGTGSIFSLVTAGGASAVGSTFLDERPGAEALAPLLLERGARFVPALRGAAPVSVRACARPQSRDGLPLLGPVPWLEGLHLASGHGPWGISLGPGSARLVAAGVLGEPSAIAPELAAARFGAP